MLYTVTNKGRGPRLMYGIRNRPEQLKPGESREIDLPDGVAIMIRRGTLKGDTLHIESTTPKGEDVLQIAHTRPPRRDRTTLLPPKKLQPAPFIDEFVIEPALVPVETQPAPVVPLVVDATPAAPSPTSRRSARPVRRRAMA